jgi:hypothetical protein
MAQIRRGLGARRLAATVLALASLLAAREAEAAVRLEGSNGWTLSFDGFVNAFGANEMGSATPGGAAADPLMSTEKLNAFRVRTGLLPGLFAFNVSAPTTEGLDLKARIGLYPQINNGNTRNAFGSQIDLREIFFTVDGRFGQVLVGRALNLFQGKNILTDMTLFGVGVQGAVSSGGTTLGRIGYGYLYTQFGAQLRYTTPSLSGLKLAASVADPSRICAAGSGCDPASGPVASVTKAPGFEAEISYAGKFGDTAAQAWVSGLYQTASIAATATAPEAEKTASGVAGGASVSFAGLDLLASGFLGKGLGSFLMLDIDALDTAGEERETAGVLAQASYVLGSTKIGLSYGQNSMQETDGEKAARLGGGPSALRTRSSWTGGVYHDIAKNLKVVAEYTHATSEWHGGQSQAVDVAAVGGFFFW